MGYTWAPKRKHFRITTKMLVFLSLLSMASAAPQTYFLPGYPSMTHYTPSVAHYNPYVAPYVNSYAALPRVAQVPQVARQIVDAQDYAVVSAYPRPDSCWRRDTTQPTHRHHRERHRGVPAEPRDWTGCNLQDLPGWSWHPQQLQVQNWSRNRLCSRRLHGTSRYHFPSLHVQRHARWGCDHHCQH